MAHALFQQLACVCILLYTVCVCVCVSVSGFKWPLIFCFICRFVFVELPDIRKDVQCPICLGTELLAIFFSSPFLLNMCQNFINCSVC